jgi:hypothetical protein
LGSSIPKGRRKFNFTLQVQTFQRLQKDTPSLFFRDVVPDGADEANISMAASE